MDIGRHDLIEYEFNPLCLKRGPRVSCLDESVSINGIIERNGIAFVRPFIVLVDGQPVSRKDWDNPLHPGCEVRFIELPAGGGSNPLRILALLAVMALSFWLGGLAAAAFGKIAGALVTGIVGYGGSMLINYFLGAASIPASDAEGKSDFVAYSLSTGNQLSIGLPVPEHFGRIRFFPPLAQSLYTKFVGTGYMGDDNRFVHKYEQHLYMLGIVGYGQYTINGVYIDKTPISEYSDVEYNILPPGTAPTLCTRIAYVSNEVTGQELTDEWIKFVVNPIGSRVSTIECDVMFPNGLIGYWNETGNIFLMAVSVWIEARLIDNDGVGQSDWANYYAHTFSAATTTPLAFTLPFQVPGNSTYRYEIRIGRTPAKLNNPEDRTVAETVNFMALKSFGGYNTAKTDCTMIEVKMRASEQLSGNAATRIMIDATRKLYPVTGSGFGVTLTNSTSPVDAAAYIVTSGNGGGQPDTNIDFASLYTLRTLLASEGYTFNHRFTQRTSVMEACALIGRCCRSVPFMPGGLFSMVMDREQSVPVQVYNENDITKDSLVITHRLRTADDPTCVEVRYTDYRTLETKSAPLYYDADGSEDNPFVIDLSGCTDLDQAYKIASYMYLDDKLNRTTAEFVTGLKGHIPYIGQKVIVGSSCLDWSQSGLVAHLDGNTLFLSEPVDFAGGATAVIYLSTPTGGLSGPHDVTPGQLTHSVIGDWTGLDIRTIHTDAEEATKFLFGVTVSEMLPVRVLRLLPQSENEVRIVGSIVHDEVYVDPGSISEPDEPEGDLLDDVTLDYKGVVDLDYSYVVTWSGEAATVRIELDEGTGYSILQDNYADHKLAFATDAENISVKVTPYEDGSLVLASAITVTFSVPPAPTNVTYAKLYDFSSEVYYHFTWDRNDDAHYSLVFSVSDVVTHSLTIYNGTDPNTVSVDVYLAHIYRTDPSITTFDFDVTSILSSTNIAGKPSSFTVVIDAPDMPTDFECEQRLTSGVILSWTNNGAPGYVIYWSTTEGFDPLTEGTLVWQSNTGYVTSATISGLDMTGSYHHYFRVAGFDVPGYVRSGLNFSVELKVLPESGYEDVVDDLSAVVTTVYGYPVQILI